jgi:hypothetical protein
LKEIGNAGNAIMSILVGGTSVISVGNIKTETTG